MSERIHLLGTASGIPHPDRAPSAILVEDGREGMLIDTGDGVARTLAKQEYSSLLLRTVILTHNHTDHVAGFPALLQGLRRFDRREPLDVYAPQALGDALLRWIKALRLAPEKLPFELRFHPLTPGTLRTESGMETEIWETDHFTGAGTGDVCYGLTLHLPDGNWVFSSDIRSLDPLKQQLAGARGLIVESTHIAPEDAVLLARDMGVERIILTHIPPECDLQAIEGAEWASDGMIVDTGLTGEVDHDR